MSGKKISAYPAAPTLPTIHNTKLVAQSNLFKIEQLNLEFTNGEKRQYERMKGSGRGAVMVVPCISASEFILVREYAAGIHGYEVGFPKGLIDPGETPEEAANRELKEEIGFGAKRFIKLKTVSMAPSYFSAQMHIYIALDLYEESLEGDEPEPLEKITWRWSDAGSLLDKEDFNEARSVAALFLAQQKIDSQPDLFK